MSGVFGIIGSEAPAAMEDALARMAKAGAHRGPDGSALRQGPGYGIGHLHHQVFGDRDAPQPLGDADERCWIVLDGDIQNYDELHAALFGGPPRAGAEPSFAALFLAAYRKFGPDCVKHIDGAFAVAIWDDEAKLCFLARDRLGIKPLFHARWNGAVVFASEIQQILALPGFPRVPNEPLVADYLVGDVDLSRETFFANIERLPAGSRVVARDGTLRIEDYWDLDPSRTVRFRNEAEYGERFREIFTRSVRYCMNVGLPLGSNLSGGLDSSSIVCVADALRRQAGETEPMHTFSLSFEDKLVDEGVHVEAVRKATNITHHSYFADGEDLFRHIPTVQARQAEPMRSLGVVLFWRLKQLAEGSGVRVLLNGMGADEILGSINLYYLADLLREGRWIELRRTLAHLVEADPYSVGLSARGLLREFALKPLTPPGLMRLKRRLTGSTGYPDLIDPAFARRVDLSERVLARRPAPYRDEFRRVAYDGLRRIYTPLLMHYEDTNNAGFGLESRFPFLDRELVEFLFSLPREEKVRAGTAKVVLREAMRGVLPESVRTRADKGFIDRRVDHWLGHQYKDVVERVLWGQALGDSGWVDIDRLRTIYREYQEGAGHRLAVWKSFNLGIWLETFFD